MTPPQRDLELPSHCRSCPPETSPLPVVFLPGGPCRTQATPFLKATSPNPRNALWLCGQVHHPILGMLPTSSLVSKLPFHFMFCPYCPGKSYVSRINHINWVVFTHELAVKSASVPRIDWNFGYLRLQKTYSVRQGLLPVALGASFRTSCGQGREWRWGGGWVGVMGDLEGGKHIKRLRLHVQVMVA